MAPEGMVHALKLISGLLVPGGLLIDIHPSGEPPRIEVRVGQQSHLAGYLRESDDFIEYTHAAAALQQIVDEGWYAVRRRGTFTFNTYASSMEELSDFLRQNYTDAILGDEVVQQAQSWLNLAQANEVEKPHNVVMSESVLITCYRPLARRATIRSKPVL
jgi:hypothetical protein